MHLSDSENTGQFFSWDLHGAGRRRGSGSRLRKRGRHRRVEAHIALDLLEDLMDVPVENRDRAEAFEQSEGLLAIGGAPSPVGIDGPERDVGEDDNRRTALQSGEILLEPVELRLSEFAHAFELNNINEADEVNSFVIKGVPAASFGVFAIALEIELSIIDRSIVLARDVEDLAFRCPARC